MLLYHAHPSSLAPIDVTTAASSQVVDVSCLSPRSPNPKTIHAWLRWRQCPSVATPTTAPWLASSIAWRHCLLCPSVSVQASTAAPRLVPQLLLPLLPVRALLQCHWSQRF